MVSSLHRFTQQRVVWSCKLPVVIPVRLVLSVSSHLNGCRPPLWRPPRHLISDGSQICLWHTHLPAQDFHGKASRVGAIVCSYDQSTAQGSGRTRFGHQRRGERATSSFARDARFGPTLLRRLREVACPALTRELSTVVAELYIFTPEEVVCRFAPRQRKRLHRGEIKAVTEALLHLADKGMLI